MKFKTIIKCIASGGAFLGVLLSAGGCSFNSFARSGRPAAPVLPPPPPPVVVAPPVHEPIPSMQPPARPRLGHMLVDLPGDASASSSAAEAGFQQHTASDEGYDADVATDPTGKWMVFASTRHSERSHIYMQRVDGTAVTQLTGEDANDAQPAVSPDGKRIAFSSTRSGNWDIYIMDADGRNIEQVTGDSTQEMHPSFSPDGTRLVYCALAPRTDQWELWVINLATHERKMIGNGIFPVWSPGKGIDRIAFQRARQRGSRCFSLWTIDLVDGEPRRLTEIAASSNAAVIAPTWSPDGARLAFATVPVSASSANRPLQDIWVVSSDGGGRRRLTEGSATNLSPFWAVDNRIYFISDRSGRDNIWSVRVDPTSSNNAVAVQPARSVEPKATKPEKPAAVGSIDPLEIDQ